MDKIEMKAKRSISVWLMVVVCCVVGGSESFVCGQSLKEAWVYICDGKSEPSTTQMHVWANAETKAAVIDEGLHIDATNKGRRWYFANWSMVPFSKGIVEAKLKTLACDGPSGNSITVADGVHEATITFYPDRIEWDGLAISVPFGTKDAFHAYRIEIDGPDLMVYADGQLIIDGTGKLTTPAENGRNIVGFGCAASTVGGSAIWSQVRYQTIETTGQARIENLWMSDLKVEMGPTVVIVPASDNPSPYFPVFAYRDGRMVVHSNYWSKDRGLSWQKGVDGPPGNDGVSVIELHNGDVIAMDMSNWILEGDSGWYNGGMLRFKPDGKFEREQARTYIPDGGKGMMYDDETFKEGEAGVFDHNIVQLPNGDLIATMVGNFKDDKVQIPYFEYPIFKYRTWVVRSSDQGKTWEYLATVAYDPEIGMESFCEPTLLRLNNGDLLVAMRTDGRGEGGPVYLTRSTDNGKTWAKPKPITHLGVCPNMIQLENGVLVLTFGRPIQWLAFSTDNGNTWKGHFSYSKYRGSDYNWVLPVGSDKVMAIYYRAGIAEPGSDTLLGEIVGTTFTVTPISSKKTTD